MDSKGIVVLVVGAMLCQAGAYGVVAGDTGSVVAQSDTPTVNETTTDTDETGQSGFPDSVYADSDDETTSSTATTAATTDTETTANDSSSESSSTAGSEDSPDSSSSSGSTPSADDTTAPSGPPTTTDTATDSRSPSPSPSSSTPSSSDSGSPGASAPVRTLQPDAPTAQPGADGVTTDGGASGGTGAAPGGISGAPSGAAPSSGGSATGGPSSSTPGGSGAPPVTASGSSAGASPEAGAGTGSAPGTGAGSASAGAGTGGTTAGSAQAGSATVSPDAEFDVVSSSIDAAAGSDGTLTVRLENTGEDAENAVVTLQSGSGELTFGGAPTTSQFVGDWDEGDRKTIEVDTTVAPGSSDRSYPVTATVAYDDPDDERVQSPPTTFGVTPGGEQDFSLDSVDSSLSAGSDGTISGTITNEGPETAESAVLVFAGNTSDITPRQSEVVLGDINSGESVDFTYPVSVLQGAPPGDRQVPFVVQYGNADGDTLQSGTLNAQVTIDEAADDLAVVDVDSDLEPGQQGTVSVTLENTGEDAEDAVINLQSLSGVVLFGESPNTSQFVGEWEAGDRKTIEVSAVAAPDVAEGGYPVQASVSYTDGDNEPAGAGPVTFGVDVGTETDDFEVVSTSSTVPIGDEGTVSVTLNNTGENATEATVSLASLSPDVVVGSTGNATRFVGEWPAGEQRTVEYQVRASNETEQRSYPLRVSTSYTDSDGDPARSDARTFGVTPLREQAFTLDNVSGNLSVGEEGTVTGTVTNEGPGEARNAVVTLTADNQNVNPQETEFALGTLAAGESANFSFPIEVTDSAEGGVRQLSFAVEYDNSEGDPRTSDTISTQVDVAPQRDEFTVTRTNASLDVGATETVDLEITNNRNSTVRNINAKAFADSPLSLADDEAFIPELGPGESANITFEVSATGSATAGTYPLSLDFQYDTADGESKLSETYDVPIEVREPESGGLLSLGGDGGLPIVPILLAVLLVVIIAAVVIRRRNGGGGDGANGNDGRSGGTGGDE